MPRIWEERRDEIAASGRARSINLLVSASPSSAVALAAWTVLSAVVPVAMAVAMGVTVGRLPSATRDGFDSAAGRGLVDALVATGVLFVLVMVLAPVKELLAATIKVRLTNAMQQRLADAVSGPTRIEHLEDPSVLDKLALAQGSLMTYFPADAPVLLASVVAAQASGILACVVIGAYRWWLGLIVLVFWRAVRRPLRRDLLEVVKSFGGEADVMRRSEYLRLLATQPSAAKELRVFGLGYWIIDSFREQWFAGMSTVWKRMDRLTRSMVAMAIGIFVVYGFACFVIADSVLHDDIGIGMLATVLPLLMVAAGAGSTSFDDVGLEFSAASLPNLDALEHDLQARARSGRQQGTVAVADRPREEIRFSHVAFRYPGGASDVFRNLDLVLPAGSSTAIVGPNGAGKTTFVKLLAGLHAPSEGVISVDGTPLGEFQAEAWQRNVAVVFQDFIRYPLSAIDNVVLGAVTHRDDVVGRDAAARRAGALTMVEDLPHRWDTVLAREYERGVDLSGGQWQRIALARALFATEHGASVLVLDEPTAWLDARGEADFFERFLEITHGLTTVVISHRFSTVRRAEHIIVVDKGGVVERGTHDELVTLGGTYAHAFLLQAARFADGDAPSERSDEIQ